MPGGGEKTYLWRFAGIRTIISTITTAADRCYREIAAPLGGNFVLRQGRRELTLDAAQKRVDFYHSKGKEMRAKPILAVLLLSLLLCACKSPKQPNLGEPLAGLTPEQSAQFREGKKVFERVFEPKD